MLRTELKYGVVGAAILCVYKYIEYQPVFQITRLESDIYTGLFTYVIIITTVILGVRNKRTQQEDKVLSFKDAFMAGFFIIIVMAVIAVSLMYLNAKYLNHGLAEQMFTFSQNNLDGGSNQTLDDFRHYYSPGHRMLRIAEDLFIPGTLVSLFSAGMFRRAPADLDLAKRPKIPSTLKKVFMLATALTIFTVLVYLAWVLRTENITNYFYDFLVDPINPTLLQAGTACLSLASLVLNITYYNRTSHYRKRHNKWNILMIFISGVLFFTFLWTIF